MSTSEATDRNVKLERQSADAHAKLERQSLKAPGCSMVKQMDGPLQAPCVILIPNVHQLKEGSTLVPPVKIGRLLGAGMVGHVIYTQFLVFLHHASLANLDLFPLHFYSTYSKLKFLSLSIKTDLPQAKLWRLPIPTLRIEQLTLYGSVWNVNGNSVYSYELHFKI